MTPSDDKGLREAARSIAGTLAKWLEDYHELSTELLKFEHPADREQFYKLAERLISQKIIEAEQPLWYICTDFFRNGGTIVMGGFETKELALKVRRMYEQLSNGKTYAVDTLTTKQDTKETTE